MLNGSIFIATLMTEKLTWCMFAYEFMPETHTEGEVERVVLVLSRGGEAQSGHNPQHWLPWLPVQQSPQLGMNSRHRMQILTTETATAVWDLAEVEGERGTVLACSMGDVFGCLCHQMTQHQTWQKWVTKFYLALCSLKPQLYKTREAGMVCAYWFRNGDCKLMISDTRRGASSLLEDGQLHDNLVPGSL